MNTNDKTELSFCCGAKAKYYGFLPDFPKCSKCGKTFKPKTEELKEVVDGWDKKAEILNGIPAPEEKKCGHGFDEACDECVIPLAPSASWEERFDMKFDNKINAGYKKTIQKEIKSFIRSLLQATRAEALAEEAVKCQEHCKDAKEEGVREGYLKGYADEGSHNDQIYAKSRQETIQETLETLFPNGIDDPEIDMTSYGWIISKLTTLLKNND